MTNALSYHVHSRLNKWGKKCSTGQKIKNMGSQTFCLSSIIFILWNIVLVGSIAWQFYITRWRLNNLEQTFIGSADEKLQNLNRFKNFTYFLKGKSHQKISNSEKLKDLDLGKKWKLTPKLSGFQIVTKCDSNDSQLASL